MISWNQTNPPSKNNNAEPTSSPPPTHSSPSPPKSVRAHTHSTDKAEQESTPKILFFPTNRLPLAFFTFQLVLWIVLTVSYPQNLFYSIKVSTKLDFCSYRTTYFHFCCFYLAHTRRHLPNSHLISLPLWFEHDSTKMGKFSPLLWTLVLSCSLSLSMCPRLSF